MPVGTSCWRIGVLLGVSLFNLNTNKNQFWFSYALLLFSMLVTCLSGWPKARQMKCPRQLHLQGTWRQQIISSTFCQNTFLVLLLRCCSYSRTS